MSRRSIYTALALVMLSIATISSVSVLAQLQISKTVVKGSDWDDWAKGVKAIDNNTIIVYGNRYRSLLIAKVDLSSETAIWGTLIGSPDTGDLGNWSEARSIAYDGQYIYVFGYANRGGGKQGIVVKIDASTGNVEWVKWFNVSNTRFLSGTVAENFVIAVGVTKDFGANNRDGIIAIFDKNGDLKKVYLLDLGGSEYLTDVVYKNGKLYLVGMSDATGDYDIVVIVATVGTDGSVTIEKAVRYGKSGEYEIAGYLYVLSDRKDWKSGNALVVDDLGGIWVLGLYRNASNKITSLVIRFSPDLDNVDFAKRLHLNDSNHELQPIGIVVVPGSLTAYVVAATWLEAHGWQECAALFRIDNGMLSASYALYASNWQSIDFGSRNGGIAVYGDVTDFRLYVAFSPKVSQINYDLEDLEAASGKQVIFDDWSGTLTTVSFTVTDVTSDASSTLQSGASSSSINFNNVGSNNHNIAIITLNEASPPPPIPEMNYVTLMIVVAVIVLATAIYMISRKL